LSALPTFTSASEER